MAAATFIVFGTDEMVNLSEIKAINIIATGGQIRLQSRSADRVWVSEPYSNLAAAAQAVKELDIALHRIAVESSFSPSGN